MKILVYGVGPIGALAIHYLCIADNDVTVVARSTYDELKTNGIVIEHYIQKKKTVDHPTIVKEADTTVNYDIVFSIMQGQQQKPLLDTFCKLNTKLIVLVGNNMEADYCEQYIQEHKVSERHVVFAFQNSAGRRENSKVICGRLPTTPIDVGGLHSKADSKDIELIRKAFNTKGVKINEMDEMYGFYFCHVAEVMPYCYVCYKNDYNLKKASSKEIKMIMKATKECFDYLKSCNITIMPPKEDEYYKENGFKPKAMYSLYRIMGKTFLGSLMVSDHCKNGIKEMKYLDEKFNEYRMNNPGPDMPTWDEMREWSKTAFNI